MKESVTYQAILREGVAKGVAGMAREWQGMAREWFRGSRANVASCSGWGGSGSGSLLRRSSRRIEAIADEAVHLRPWPIGCSTSRPGSRTPGSS